MTALQTELDHLVNLMAPPWREAWKSYCWAKAVYLAESNKEEYGDLPRQLKEAMLASFSSPLTSMPVSGTAEVSTPTGPT
jgi:hypothetical protein